MPAVIQVPYAELFTRADTIRTQADTIDREVNTLDQTVSSLDWMGERASHFRRLWESSRPEMQSWAKTVRAFADELQTQATKMRDADNGGGQ